MNGVRSTESTLGAEFNTVNDSTPPRGHAETEGNEAREMSGTSVPTRGTSRVIPGDGDYAVRVNSTARIAADGLLLAGGGRAILLQIAHPDVARGVARHSDFRQRPMDRLRGTLRFVYAEVLGTDEDRRRVRRAVGAAHRPVRAPDTAERPGYSAFDPALQLWVAATLYETTVTVHEKVWGPLGAADADALYRDYAVLGTGLQMPAELWPADRAAFARYWAAQISSLRVSEEARGVAQDLLHPARPWWLRPLMPFVGLLTTALLDDRLRRAFALPDGPRRRAREARAWRVVGALWRRLPRRLRELPHRVVLRDLRRAVSADDSGSAGRTRPGG